MSRPRGAAPAPRRRPAARNRRRAALRGPGKLAALLFALGCAGTVAAEGPAWPALPAPPRARLEWVARDFVHGHLPMRIWRFASPASVAEVIGAYRAHWTAAYPLPPIVVAAEGGVVVSQLHGPFLMTVKAIAAGPGSEGLLAVTRLGSGTARSGVLRGAGAPAPTPTGTSVVAWPPLPGAQLLAETRAVDHGLHTHTRVLRLPGSPRQAQLDVVRALAAQGWQALVPAAGAGHPQAVRRGEIELAWRLVPLVEPHPSPHASALVMVASFARRAP